MLVPKALPVGEIEGSKDRDPRAGLGDAELDPPSEAVPPALRESVGAALKEGRDVRVPPALLLYTSPEAVNGGVPVPDSEAPAESVSKGVAVGDAVGVLDGGAGEGVPLKEGPRGVPVPPPPH